MTKVTIGLCVRNSEKEVNIALNSVAKQDYPHELMKLVVVDDGCTDNTIPIVKKFVSHIDIKTEIISSGGKGLGTARQLAVDHAEGNYIVWVDDDYALQTCFVRKQVEYLDRNPIVGAARPYVNAKTGKSFSSLGYTTYLIQSETPDAIGTGGAIFRLNAIDQVHGFDTAIKGAGEDRDISKRIKNAGWQLAVNNSAVLSLEYPDSPLRVIWKRHKWYGYANHFLFHKHYDRQVLLTKFPPIAIISGLKDSVKIYSIIQEKGVFLLPLYNLYIYMAELFGFVCSHADGYGHS